MLSELLDLDARDFLAGPWPDEPVGCHGDLTRLAWLDAVPELRSTQDYLAHVASTSAQATFSIGVDSDEHESHTVAGSDLDAFYRHGGMFGLGGAQRYSPGLGGPLEELRRELRLPAFTTSRSIVYGAKPGSGAAWHWDAGANFVVQLAGVKRWHLAENTVVINPPDRYATTMATIPDRLVGLLPETAKGVAPEDVHSVDLVPGSVLFVPRGYWHSTECLQESLAVNFTYGQPDHVQVLTRYLAATLRSDVRWRSLARDPSDAPDPALFGRLLAEATAHLATCEPAEILAAVAASDL